MNKKALGIFLSLMMLICILVACNNGESEQVSKEEKKEPTGDTTEKSDGVVTLDLFVDQPWWPLKDWSGAVPEEITKRTGVKLNITVASDAQQLPLMIASGSLPDLVVTSEQFNRMSDPKLSHDWQSLIDKYTPDFKIDQSRIGVNTVSDGKYYSIKNNFSTAEEWEEHKEYALNSGASITYRADILEELGNPKIETMEDFKEVFLQVKENYPDMTPLVLNPTDTWAKGYFALNYGADLGGFVDDENGDLIHALRTDYLKNVYMFMNDLYLDGIIKAETYAFQNEDQAKSLATSGKAFAYAWTSAGADILNAEAEEGMKWANLPLKINEDFAHTRRDTGWQGVFITKNNKNEEASIKLMEFLLSKEGQELGLWGIEGEHWNWSEDGGYPEFTYARNDEEVRAELGVNWWGLLGGSAVIESLGNYQPGTELTKTNQELNQYTKYQPELGMVQPDADSQEQVIQTNIDNMITNEESKVLLANSREEAEAAYDDMLKKAEQIGMTDLEKWANKKYKEVLKGFE